MSWPAVPAPNPATTVFDRQQPFIYLHVTQLHETELTAILQHGTSVELDLATTAKGHTYIGHSPAWYTFRRIKPSQNLPVAEVVDRLANSSIYVILDCKDTPALKTAADIIKRLGAHRCLLHVSVRELAFQPYLVEEPQWESEFIPLEQIKQLHTATHVPVILACRGLSQEKFLKDPTLITRLADVAGGTAIAINFDIAGTTALPPTSALNILLERHILPWINVDAIPESHRPHLYLGATSNPTLTTATLL